MPPLRPDAPPPQMSRSSTTTSQPGSRCLSPIAVHSPTKPPPRIAMSARCAPSSGGAGCVAVQCLLQPEGTVWCVHLPHCVPGPGPTILDDQVRTRVPDAAVEFVSRASLNRPARDR